MEYDSDYKPVTFFALTFTVTWISWFTAPLIGDPENSDATFIVLMLVGLLAPFAIALYLIFKSRNEQLKRTFFN